MLKFPKVEVVFVLGHIPWMVKLWLHNIGITYPKAK